MTRFLIGRLGRASLVVCFVIVVVFTALRISPGDPATLKGGVIASPESIREFREEFGTDKSLPDQLGSFISRAAQGDLGESFRYAAPVTDLIAEAAPYTALLAATALLLSLTIALLLGVSAARTPGGVADKASSLLAAAGQATPVFWLGLLLIQLFAVQLQWLPSGGMDSPSGLILPAVAVALTMVPTQLRVLRASMNEALGRDFVRTARAFGVSENRISYVYALRNAALPVISVVGVDIGYLLGGVIVVEAVFNYPGLGQLAISAVSARDFPLIQALAIGSAIVFVFINFLIDLVYGLVDPRVRTVE